MSLEEYSQLEKNIIADGCREPLVLWRPESIACPECDKGRMTIGENEFEILSNELDKWITDSEECWVCNNCDYTKNIHDINSILIDGHNRYEICTKNNIGFDVSYKYFDSESHAKIWMIDNQEGRRNLPDGWKYQLKLTKKEELLKVGKESMSEGGKGLSIVDKPSHNTQKTIANDLGWSTGKVAMADKVWKEATPEIKEQVLANTLTINQAYQSIKDDKSYGGIARKIQSLAIPTQAQQNEKNAKELNVNLGDVYLINKKHKLIIADSNNTDFITKHTGVIDCVLTDPPYGINYKSPSGSGLAQRGDYDIIENDNVDFDPSILFKYSKNIITWGANHYSKALDSSAGWIVWDKRDGEQINNNSDCELAWTNMLGSARLFHHKWNGMIKDSEHGESRIHPTQKPIKLMAYCLEICRSGNNIIDLYAGSGSTLIACEETGRTANLVELSPVYGAAMINRFKGLGYSVEKYGV